MQGARIRGRGLTVVALLLLLLLFAQGLAANRADASNHLHPRRAHILALTNEDRAEHDQAALALDAKLSRYAKRHSTRMAEKGYLFHSTDLASKLEGVDWSIGGENVGVGTTLEGLENAFMRSKPHRKNILRKAFDNTAIGIVKADGKLWVTIIFYG